MARSTRAPRRSADQWQALVDVQRHSGLSAAAFCKARNIAYASFMNWKKKLRSTTPDQLPAQNDFVELTQDVGENRNRHPEWIIELDLAPGIQLRIAR